MKKHLFPFVFLVVPLILLFAPVLMLNKTFVPLDQLHTMNLPYAAAHDSVDVYNHFLTDVIAQVYPYKVRLRENLKRGEIASWNPSLFGGHPHYASTSFTHFDPTNVILLFADMPAAYHWQMLIKLLIAGVGMYLLLGVFVRNEAVRGLFAMAYMLNSMFIATMQHQWIVGALGWMPYCIWLLWRYFDTKRLPYAIGSALFLGLAFLAGSLQIDAICVIILTVLVVARAWWSEQGKKREERSLKTLVLHPTILAGGIFLLAFCAAAVMFLPSIELFLHNFNVRLNQQENRQYSLVRGLMSVPLLISFAFPELLGSVRGYDITKIVKATMNDFTAYMGFVPFLLGLWGAVALWKPRADKADVRPFIALMVLGILIPLFTPAYKFLYHRCFLIYIMGLTVVGAVALDELLRQNTAHTFETSLDKSFDKWRKYALVGMLMLCGGLLVGNIMFAVKHEAITAMARTYIERNMEQGQLAAGNRVWMLGRVTKFFAHYSLFAPTMIVPIASIGAALMIFAFRTRLRHHLFVASLAALTAFQLLFSAWLWLPLVDVDKYPFYPPTQATNFLQRDTTHFRILPVWDAASYRLFQPNMTDMYGIASVQGYESIFPPNLSRSGGGVEIPPTTHSLRLVGLANVKYLATSTAIRFEHPALTLVDSGAVNIWQNAYWRDRAYMTYRYEVVKTPDAQYARMLDTNAYNGHSVLLYNEPSQQILFADTVTNTVRIGLAENNRVVIHVQTAEAGYFVLADTWYPGWKALVNGNVQEILQANFAQRAVIVPAGESTVEFRFEPASFRVGAWVSAVSIAASMLVCMVMSVGKRSSKNSQSAI